MIAWCVVLSRIGLALIKPALNVAALRALQPELLGQGAGMINFARQLGGAFGVNLLSVTLDRRTFFHSDALTSMQTAANSATAELLRQIGRLLAQARRRRRTCRSAGALHYLGRVVYAQAYTMGFRDSFLHRRDRLHPRRSSRRGSWGGEGGPCRGALRHTGDGKW